METASTCHSFSPLLLRPSRPRKTIPEHSPTAITTPTSAGSSTPRNVYSIATLLKHKAVIHQTFKNLPPPPAFGKRIELLDREVIYKT